MTSGRVQLASVGLQDKFLTGDPQITYFLQNFKRHTKFALETLDNPVTGDIGFGNEIRCIVPRKGDLIRTIFLKVELSPITGGNDAGYTNSIGHAMIDYADLVIGGQTIERLTGEYIEIYSDMFVSDSQQEGVTELTGKTTTRTGLGPASTVPAATVDYYGVYPRIFIIALPFYFYKHDSLSIPLNSLYRQEVEVVVKFRPVEQLIVATNGVPSDYTAAINNISVPIEFVFLSEDENNFFRNRETDYVITQLQRSSYTMEANDLSKTVRLRFVNPVKEMFFIIQNQSNVIPNVVSGNSRFDFANSQNLNSPIYNQIQSMKLTFNNDVQIEDDVADALFLRRIQPMLSHTRSPSLYIYNYSFSLHPEKYIPTGQVNMSRIQNTLLTINTTPNTIKRNVRVYARSYNVLRFRDGIAGVLFIDNNFI